MDNNKAKTCQGTTLAGNACTRSINLDVNGYCHQHAAQFDLAKNHPNDNNCAPLVSEPEQVAQDAPPAPLARQQSMDVNSEDEQQKSEHSSSGSSSSSSSSSSVHLVRCVAVSRSTNTQCKNHVSFEGETHCSIHGGAKKGPVLPLLPQCNAIAKLSRKQCTKRVSVPGEQFCPAHHGKIKANLRLVAVLSPTGSPVQLSRAASSEPEMVREASVPLPGAVATIPWSIIHAQTIEYLVDVHPATCICTPNNRCQTMQSIKLMLGLAGHSVKANPETIVEWFRLLGSASDPTKFWQLSIYQLIVTSTAAANRHAPPPAPAPRRGGGADFALPFRMPSDGLDSFLNESDPTPNNAGPGGNGTNNVPY